VKNAVTQLMTASAHAPTAEKLLAANAAQDIAKQQADKEFLVRFF
jgi:hypothetical protein